MRKHIPANICERIYDILVKHADAPEQYRSSFMHNYSNPESHYKPTEFRVCSRWGMAGKFWWANDKFYVSGRSMVECSDERDYHMEQVQVDLVNELLAPLYEEFKTRVNA